MPIEANYVTYYGIHLDHYSTSWGGNTYNKLLVTEYPSEDLVSTVSTESTDVTFLYPRVITNKTYLDGLAEGHITFYNTSGSESTVTTMTVSLKSTEDVPSSTTVLGSYSGSYSDASMADDGFLTLPFYIPIDEQTLNENEKILLNITFTASTGNVSISHALDSSLEDIKIKIPYSAPIT
jgi:hypothetical protein